MNKEALELFTINTLDIKTIDKITVLKQKLYMLKIELLKRQTTLEEDEIIDSLIIEGASIDTIKKITQIKREELINSIIEPYIINLKLDIDMSDKYQNYLERLFKENIHIIKSYDKAIKCYYELYDKRIIKKIKK